MGLWARCLAHLLTQPMFQLDINTQAICLPVGSHVHTRAYAAATILNFRIAHAHYMLANSYLLRVLNMSHNIPSDFSKLIESSLIMAKSISV